MLHLVDAFSAAARRTPDHPCVVAEGRRLTYAQVDRESQALAAALADLGIGPGDRIAALLPNWPETITTLVAAARLGATLVPINPSLSYHELKYQLRHAEVSLVVTAPSWDGRDFLEWFDELIVEVPEVLYLVAVGGDDLWYDDRIFPYGDLVSKGQHLAAPEPARDPGAVLALLYTSGTTGKAKGVLLSHRSLVGSAVATGQRLGLGAEDRVLLAVPAFTVFGLSVIAGTLAAGATLVLQERFAAEGAAALMAREGVTVCHGVPTMFTLLLREHGFTRAQLPALRTGLVAGSPVDGTLADAVRRVCNVEIAYGLTETGPTVAMTAPLDPAVQRRETVGRVLDGVEVGIVDLITGGRQGPESVGELVVKSPTLMSGYHRMPAETRRSFTPDGFFLTGDLARLDEGGFVRIVGRRKEIIIRGGMNVHPREVEDVLRAHPAVEDVAVVGVPHDVLGEQICACIVTAEGAALRAEDLLAFAREQMADHKVPDLVRQLDALPLTASGKVKRRELAQQIALELMTS